MEHILSSTYNASLSLVDDWKTDYGTKERRFCVRSGNVLKVYETLDDAYEVYRMLR